jgi:hypothetical protein
MRRVQGAVLHKMHEKNERVNALGWHQNNIFWLIRFAEYATARGA